MQSTKTERELVVLMQETEDQIKYLLGKLADLRRQLAETKIERNPEDSSQIQLFD